MPAEGFADYLIDHEADLADAMPAIDHLPYEECILDFAASRHRLFSRTLASIKERQGRQNEQDYILLSVSFSRKRESFAMK